MRAGETTGLGFDTATLSLFDAGSGRALPLDRAAARAAMRGGRRMAEVRLSGVSKRFGDVAAVQEMSMMIPDGAFVVLLGPTGAGKTTTLRLDRRAGGAGRRAASPSAGARWRARPRRSATWRWCSSSIRSTRT